MYKKYNMQQLNLPLFTDVIFEENDIVFFVNDIVESIPENSFSNFNSKFGASSYHPKMMLKIILFSYTQSIFSGRKIATALNDSLRLMWLSQGQKPSYRTINRFRINPELAKILEELFVQFRCQLIEQGLIDENVLFIDGTKIEANANKYTFVWRKNTERYNLSNEKKSREMYNQLLTENIIPEMNIEDDDDISIRDLNEMKDCLDRDIEKLDAQINESKIAADRKVIRNKRSKIKKYRKTLSDCIDKKQKYEEEFKNHDERNSHSKTDKDATFMRMKDDHMKNGQLKPGYNIQIATNNQYIMAYDIFSNPTDIRTLEPFLEGCKKKLNGLPEVIVADAGYGSEYNYEILADKFGVTGLIPYGMMRKEETKSFKNDKFNPQNWEFDIINDYFVCPNKKKLKFLRYSYRIDKYDYRRDFEVYKCDDCLDCPLKNECLKSKDEFKIISKNMKWEQYKNNIKELLSDSQNQAIYAQRKVDVETAFGNLKANLGFARLSVRGKRKVYNELGVILMATNLRKYTARRAEFQGKIQTKKNSTFILMKSGVLFIQSLFMSRPLLIYILYNS